MGSVGWAGRSGSAGARLVRRSRNASKDNGGSDMASLRNSLQPDAVVVNGDTVTIPVNLVLYLRRGVKEEVKERNEELVTELGKDSIDEVTVQVALGDFDVTRDLFDEIGGTSEPGTEDIDVSRDRYGWLVLRAMESQYRLEARRLQDARHDGIEPEEGDVPALRTFVIQLRHQVGKTRPGTPTDAHRHPPIRRRRLRGDE